MEIEPPVFSHEYLLKSDNVPSQYRKDKLIQTIKCCNSQYFEKEGRFIIATIRKERIQPKQISYKLYLHLYEKTSPVYSEQIHELNSSVCNFKKVFIQFTEHCQNVVVLCGDFNYFIVPVKWSHNVNLDTKTINESVDESNELNGNNLQNSIETKSLNRSNTMSFSNNNSFNSSSLNSSNNNSLRGSNTSLNQLKYRKSLGRSKSDASMMYTPTIEKPIKVGTYSIGKYIKLPKEIASFVVWTTRGTGYGIIISRDGNVLFFNLLNSAIEKVIQMSEEKKLVKEALICTEDSNVNKIATFLVIIFQSERDSTSVFCQQLEIKSLRSSECINIFSRDINESALSKFTIKDRGDVQLHYFNNKTCLGFFYEMSLSLYSLYNQRLFYFDVCQSFPRSSTCFLNNKYLFQFSKLTDEVHCCGIIPLMNLYDKTPPTQLINFGIDSNYFNIRGLFPYFCNFRMKEGHVVNNSSESNFDGCILWNKYCVCIIHQIYPKEAIFCQKFLNAKTTEEEKSVIQLFTITQSVDALIQNVTKYYIDKGMIEKAQQLCRLNNAISLPLVHLNLTNLDFTEKEFDELISVCEKFIKNGTISLDANKYTKVLILIQIAKVIKFFIPNDQTFISTLKSLNSEHAFFALQYLLKTETKQFEQYILLILERYPEYIDDYIDCVKREGFNFISFKLLFNKVPIEYLSCVLTCRIIMDDLPISFVKQAFFYQFEHNPSLYDIQIISEKLEEFTQQDLNDLITFLSDDNVLFQQPFSIFYNLSFVKEKQTLFTKALLKQYQIQLKEEQAKESIEKCVEFVKKTQRFDLVKFHEVIEYSQNMGLFVIGSYLLIHCKQFKSFVKFFGIIIEKDIENDDYVKECAKVLMKEMKNVCSENENGKNQLDSLMEE